MIWLVIIALIVISLIILMFPTWVDDGLTDVRRRDRAMAALRKIGENNGPQEWK